MPLIPLIAGAKAIEGLPNLPQIPSTPAIGVSSLARAFNLQNVDIPTVKNPYEKKINQATQIDKELYRSILNTPVYTNITFLAGQYTNNKDQVVSYDKLVYEAILITVSQTKLIVKTQVQGRDGSVKEYIGMDDYSVTIQGVICGANGHHPIDEIRALKNMLDAPVPISVASTYLQNLDVHDIVVTDYTFEQKEGGYSYQTFSINAISDTPKILTVR